MTAAPGDRVSKVASVSLSVDRGGAWPYAENHKEVIEAHWKLATASNPVFFNGTIHVLTRLEIAAGRAEAAFVPTQFKNYLYWRDEGYPAEAKVRDGFGSALIRSVEGFVILGRQRPGNINEGLAYLPGGFIDHRDVSARNVIDIRASVAREVMEETGLGAEAITPGAGYLITEVAGQVSFAIPYTSPLTAGDLLARVRAHIAADPEPELLDAIVVKDVQGLEGLAMPHYARVLLSSPMAWEAATL